MSSVTGTGRAPSAERFERWREALGRVLQAPVEVRAQREADFRFTVHHGELGATRMSRFTAMPFSVQRAVRRIREPDPDLLALAMVLHGDAAFTGAGRRADLAQGTFVVYETGRPYRLEFSAPDAGAAQGLIMTFPRSLLPLPAEKLEQATGMTMTSAPGIGTLLSALLVQLATEMDHYSPAEAARLSAAALEVLAVRLTHELTYESHGDRPAPLGARRRALLTGIHAFIQRHIGDPDLSPETIAAAHHISLRLLHKLFSEEGETVAGWIRKRRLDGSRRDLADPAQAARPVAALAPDWGFRNAASFSRAFRAAYGLAPHQYRLACNPNRGDAGRLAAAGEPR